MATNIPLKARSNRSTGSAIREETARARIFEQQGNPDQSNDCLRLKRYYERRAMEECIDAP